MSNVPGESLVLSAFPAVDRICTCEWQHARTMAVRACDEFLPICATPLNSHSRRHLHKGRAGGRTVSGVTRRGWGSGEALPKEREAETHTLRSVATPQNGPREGHALNLLRASRKALLGLDCDRAHLEMKAKYPPIIYDKIRGFERARTIPF